MSRFPRVLVIGLLTLLACGPEEESLQPTASMKSAVGSTSLTCGAILTSSVTLSADVTCPSEFTGAVFEIAGDNIIFDGAGHVIDAPNAATIFSVTGRRGVVIRNVKVSEGQGSGAGVSLYDVRNSTFSHIQVSGRHAGINGASGLNYDNTFTDNNLSGNNYGLYVMGWGGTPQGGGNTFSRNLLANNEVAGLLLFAVDGSFVGPGNIIRDNGVGVLVRLSRDIKISNNTIVGNASFGVATQTSQWVVDARDNYWGHPSGPLDQDVRVEGINDDLRLSNPGGQGNAVTDFILYSPFCTNPTCEAFTPVGIDIRPGSTRNAIQLRSRGTFSVAILTTPQFDAASLDIQSIRLGDGVGEDTPVLLLPSGRRHAQLEDVDGDGDLDLVAHFSIPELVENDDLTELTSSLKLYARTMQGGTVRGSDAVEVLTN